jgi:hypothetical protein
MLARITPIGGDMYHLTVFEAGHPDQGLPGSGGRPGHLPAYPERPVDPGFGVGGVRPGQLPSFGGRPVDPGFGVGGGGQPDQGLPSHPPPRLLPGYTLVLVRGPDYKWHYAAIAPGVPVQPLPEPGPGGGGEHPDQGLPGGGGQPDQGLPGGGLHPDQGLPGHPGVPPQAGQLPSGGARPPHVGGGPIVPPGQPPTAGQLPGQPPTAQPKR